MQPMNTPAGSAPFSATPPGPRPAAPLVVRPTGYDPRDALPAGLVLTRDQEAALLAAWIANGDQPLSANQAVAAAGAALPFPTGIRRMPDEGRWGANRCEP
jgi:hypothetical protein